jgi:hypothetical protein
MLLIVCCGFVHDNALAANATAQNRVRHVILGSRQLGAHGWGYGNRSLIELSRKLMPADIPALIVLLDDGNHRAEIGARFGLASQCGAAIDPLHDHAVGAGQNLKRLEDAREVYALLQNFARCTAAARMRALEKSALVDQARIDYTAQRARRIKRRNAEDARLQSSGMKMLDHTQRATVSREDCLAVVERNRAASGIKEGTNADSDALFARARTQCMRKKSRP